MFALFLSGADEYAARRLWIGKGVPVIRVTGVVCGVLLGVLSGCSQREPVVVGDEVDAWFRMQNDYAKSLENGSGGKGFHFRPVTGAFYPLGSVFNKGSVSSLTACPFPNTDIQDLGFAQLPTVTGSFEAGGSVTAPKVLTEALAGARASASIKKTSTLRLQYTNLSLKYVDDVTVKRTVFTSECLGKVGDLHKEPKQIVRGVLYAELVVKSGHGFDASAEIGATEYGELKLKYDKNGGFEITDNKSSPRFFVVAEVGVDQVEVKNATNLTDEQLKILVENSYLQSVDDEIVGKDIIEDAAEQHRKNAEKVFVNLPLVKSVK